MSIPNACMGSPSKNVKIVSPSKKTEVPSPFNRTPASSSRSFKYDVFLSFSGDSTRMTFVSDLYKALERCQIPTYKDDQNNPPGASIKPSLSEAIGDSQIAVIIFSENYADSSWCLDELAEITKREKEGRLIAYPVFYDVEPSDVRKQLNKFGEAFAKQVALNATKAEEWRTALFDAAGKSGTVVKNTADGHETKDIEKIIDGVFRILSAVNSEVDDDVVDDDLVGMADRLQDLESLLDMTSDEVRMVGIWGVGGGGKSTLATSIYKKMLSSFQGCYNLANIRLESSEHSSIILQKEMLSGICNRVVPIYSVRDGKDKIKSRLCRRKVLILLDNINAPEQLEALAGSKEWFGGGSRIIITTRDEHLLSRADYVYHMRLLSDKEAIDLFKKHAYNEKCIVEDYDTLSSRVVSYAAGLPLALKVLGCFLWDKNKDEWTSALEKLKCIPDSKITDILKISYDGLDPLEKPLFLDIACFFRRKSVDVTMEILEACDFHPVIGIKDLQQKALITIINDGVRDIFDMHDLVQEMGHYIVRGGGPEINPEKYSRVWKHEEIKEMCSINTTTQNDTTEAIIYNSPSLLDSSRDHDYSLSLSKLVSNMKKLRWLSVSTQVQNEYEDKGPNFISNGLRYIEWSGYPARSMFLNRFVPTKLVVLKLKCSKQKKLWKDDQNLPHLKVIELVDMEELLSTPNFVGLQSLIKLTLRSCNKLKELHPSHANHKGLEYFTVSFCETFRSMPTISHMKNIKVLNLSGMYLVDEVIPSSFGELSNLEELDLSHNCILRLGFSLVQLTRLKVLNLSFSYRLVELPELPSSLSILIAEYCTSLAVIGGFNRNCKQLCQVSLTHGKFSESDTLLQSMLKENAFEKGCMHIHVDGNDIPMGFTPPLSSESSYRLELLENWCYDFSGFLMCFVYIRDPEESFQQNIYVSMKQVSGKDSEEDVSPEKIMVIDIPRGSQLGPPVSSEYSGLMMTDLARQSQIGQVASCEYSAIMGASPETTRRALGLGDREDDESLEEEGRDGNKYVTRVYYVSFESLKHTDWWNETYKAVSFEIESPMYNQFFKWYCGFGVSLVDKKTRSGVPDTSKGDRPHYTPKCNIHFDSTSGLTLHLFPYS